MPIGEMLDYIDIIIEERKREQEEINSNMPSALSDSIDDIQMAGTTYPGAFN